MSVGLKIRSAGSNPFVATILAVLLLQSIATAEELPVVNPGFEDTSGQSVFNEFTFGTPAGWAIYDPNSIQGSGVFTGTLFPNGVDFFNTLAPEGDRVSILFNSTREGDGEYGYEQTLIDVLEPGMMYSLTVEVGNIASGTATNGSFFNLDEFPGYRIELLAGGTVIADDDNSLVIPEAEFAVSTIEFAAPAGHPMLGQPLGIRLVSLNIIPPGYTQATSPDLEVDFDDIVLNAVPITSIVPPDSITVNHGQLSSGSVTDLAGSDNVDVSVRRNGTDIQARVTVTVAAVSPTELPTRFEFALESSVFARPSISQAIDLFNYDTGAFETIDVRTASRLIDQTTVVIPAGDLSRFVEPVTGNVESRVRYQAPLARAAMAANIDQVTWTVE